MYLHIGRGNVVRIEDILAITDFERLTSFKKGQEYIEGFIERDDIENPKDQLFPQSCVFVLKGVDEDSKNDDNYENSFKELFYPEETEILTLGERAYRDYKYREDLRIRKEIRKGAEDFFDKKIEDDDKFKEGGEFYIPDEELLEEEKLKGNENYERIIGKISYEEEKEVNEYVEQLFPNMRFRYNYTHYYKDNETDDYYFNSEFFNGASKEEIERILPKYNLYEKCRMVAAFRIHTEKEMGENILKYIEEKEGISYVLGFGKIYLYGKKIYYPEKTRLYIYVSEYTPLTLYKRIKEEENLGYYVSKEN